MVQRFGDPKPAYFLKNIRDGHGNWVIDESKPNINLIAKRLIEVPNGCMDIKWILSVPSESDRLST